MTDSRPLALVTGASSGIGFELARQFADHGFDLVVNAEDAGLAPAAQQLRSGGATVQEVQADLRSADGVNAVWAAIGARADMDATSVGASSKDSAEQVAKQGFEALMKGDKKLVAGGVGTKAQGLAATVLPDSVKGSLHRGMAEPGSAE
jgi:NAD(P)-dependent dehydrogenase (short-subunit alcohol dehydrogenase family)